ncbi:MAG: 2-hydroxy-3-oxopropionate reductase [Alphaproteobacteria bacterium MarineAlpha10_Bin3]|jgi:3-hydroxyisobutyrate dehydrogenase|nr:MAG: 2-hydroxy-3-oxopropionate reductase [Alphaproteobacteria bacterium MarineAlpha10_Bin3]PPR71982.1 MAG: 2-hydroxy-3-oxopropionate reductase [Alphaproteobacteria bacterium MarineAlpha4_Bin1]
MKVGFIGLGTMGASIALNAIEGGHDLVVHDIDRDTAGRHIQRGALWADTPRDVAQASDLIFTSLPGPPEVESVALGADGLIEGLSAGKAYFDLSTNSPTLIRHIHAMFAKLGVAVLDAPVSGGPDGARTGKMAIWVGGDKAAFEAALPVLNAIGDAPYYVGPVGAGAVAKLVHNCSGYILQTALAETFSMGVKAGVDPEALWQALRKGALGRRRVFDTMARQFLPGRFDPPDFALRLARKDVALACEVGREYDVPMRLSNMVLAELTEAMNRGWDGRDSRAAMLLQTERAGVEISVSEKRIREIIEQD